ncbi:MAG: glycosyltransferase family 39 protein [Bacteroidota bacterium]|nr:glycosyltransferase family 39 protein [Bacteroidota bacterium]
MTRAIIKQLWNEKPLQSIIIIAVFVRLLAAFFSQGYGFHDDHFLVIEASQSWADGTDYNDWLPKSQIAANPNATPIPSGHSFFYVGLHYLLFSLFNFLGIADPKIKMLLVRLLHALFSLIVVVLGYKITEKLSNKKNARQAGLLLAVLWAMPFLSVRNLMEVACIPFLFMGFWILLNAESKKDKLWYYLLAGLVVGLAFSIRFQTAVFIFGLGLYLLFKRNIKNTIAFGVGVVASILAIQGIVDMFVWHRPFAELGEYIRYNNEHKYEYGADRPEMYFLVLAGVVVPPIGLFFFWGFLNTWKKYTFLFLPTLLFLAFHVYFPNKQERFILPILPFFIMLGVIGWNEWTDKSSFWQKQQKLLKGCWAFFWSVNILLLIVFSLTYSKKSRIEAMYYFYNKGKVERILAEDSNRYGVQMLPNFYSGKWMTIYNLDKTEMPDSSYVGKLREAGHYYNDIYTARYFTVHPDKYPQYVLFIGDKRLDERINNLKPCFPKLAFVKKYEPGFIDKVLYKLNPVNKNETVFIYKTF